jgi:hypothetical protein
MALPPPFGPTQRMIYAVDKAAMNTKLAELQRDPRFAPMSVVLVDMTGPVHVFGGWNVHKTRYSASCVKIAAMYAAFRLRENLNEAAKGLQAKDPDDLIKKITDEWKPIVEKSITGPKDFPQLKTVFKISGSGSGWTFAFTKAYQKALEDMIGPSDNYAASTCILGLGYQYINGALAAEGLYSDTLGGLWLAGDYSSGRDAPAEKTSKSHQAASAGAIARFLILLDAKTLVSETASNEMRAMMNNSYLKRILDHLSKSQTYHFGKLGIGDGDGSYHDLAVVERPIEKGSIRYACVMLGSQGYQKRIPHLAWELDNLVESLH